MTHIIKKRPSKGYIRLFLIVAAVVAWGVLWIGT